MKAAYLSSLHLRICTSSRKPSSVSGLLTLMLNHLPKKQPGSSDCITLMSITKANSLPCWVSIWTTSLLSWPTYMHIHSRLNVFMKPWPATVITITKYKCPPPPFFFSFYKLQNLSQCVMTCLMQLAASAHAQLVEFRKHNASGHTTANRSWSLAAWDMPVMLTQNVGQ